MGFEYRVCWNANSNITFKGATDWEQWGDDDVSPEDELTSPPGNGKINLPEALDMALEASGFDWWVETREMSS